jgi:sialic acid synthase SpsE/mannose-6-phosphate isomerase-like protein (cupin superfamily)
MQSTTPLFIFEIANNHMGDVEHGLSIINNLAAAVSSKRVQCAIKFQYRDLQTFIHPEFSDRLDIKYIKRFRDTALTAESFLSLKAQAESLGFMTICTGFDEASIDLIKEHQFAAIKIASCSLTDWPLLERIALTDLPLIASVGGSSFEDIDRVVSFFDHRGKDLSLMHCVAQYPTPNDHLLLNQIDLLRKRYPGIPIGFSTHEHPEELVPVQMAVAKGASILERHVGLKTEKYPLNAYSSTPEQAAAWVDAALSALRMCGVTDRRSDFGADELAELYALRRGVFVKQSVKAGARIELGNCLLAIPTQPGQFTANDLSKYSDLVAAEDIPAGTLVGKNNAQIVDRRKSVHQIVDRLHAYIKESNIPLPNRSDMEISHHYGIDKFFEIGATLLNFVNRSYCKKVIVLLPGQSHPEHHHKVKEETFLVLHGSMTISLDGVEQSAKAGDMILVESGVKHWFATTTGVIFEEISSTHLAEDSFYTESSIQNNKDRKTYVTHWIQ